MKKCAYCGHENGDAVDYCNWLTMMMLTQPPFCL
jgi:hypothetical protein